MNQNIKTTFYIADNKIGNFYVNDTKCTKLFTLEGVLYEPNGNIIKNIVSDKGFINALTVTTVNDRFTTSSVERKIVLYQSE